MRIVLALTGLLISCFAVLAMQPPAGDDEKKLLQGQWQVTTVTEAGEVQKGDKKKFIIFDGDKVKFAEGDKADKVSEEGTFTIDSAKKPKEIDFKVKRGPSAGVYEVKGDELKLCIADKKRPTELSSTAKNEQVLIVLSRVKK
jgi:uncharacterized protein (TIGR03067 family)